MSPDMVRTAESAPSSRPTMSPLNVSARASPLIPLRVTSPDIDFTSTMVGGGTVMEKATSAFDRLRGTLRISMRVPRCSISTVVPSMALAASSFVPQARFTAWTLTSLPGSAVITASRTGS